MIDPTKPNGNTGNRSGGNGHAAPPPASPFDKPVPEGAAQTVSQVLGEIVWLMSASALHSAVLHRGPGVALVRSTKIR